MKNIFIILVLILAVQTQLHASERRIALVIGNAKYNTMGKLANPVNDANDMAEALKKLDFEVISGTNLSKSQMSEKIRDFDKKLREGNKQDTIGLFYYAGHGLEVQGKNYLIPTNAEMHFQEDASDEGIPLNRVLNNLSYSNNRMNIVILDACRDNPLQKRDRAISSSGWSAPTDASGMFIAYGTAPGRTASDLGGNGRNGLYTKHILQNIQKPGRTLEQVFKSIRQGVLIDSDRKQKTGQYNETIGADFYFIPPIKNPIVSTKPNNNNQTTNISNGLNTLIIPQSQGGRANLAPEGTVINKNLMWMRCSLGQTWNKGTNHCDGKAKEYQWEESKTKAKSYSYAGHSDWRVPTIKELETLVYCSPGKPKVYSRGRLAGCPDKDDNRPTVDQDKFPDTKNSIFWSASPNTSFSSDAWSVYFNYGHSYS
ncbi:MAG: caspase family protein, partial [Alcanivoracaceae bacterium]|nr:caspase family protein [Alcanivoracaceae bacterium]